MDIKAQIEKIVSKINGDSSVAAQFKSNPAKTVESIVGALPKDVIAKIVEGVKAKLAGGKIADTVSNIGGAIGGLFGK